MNRGLSRLSEWFDANYLLINNAKTQALPIGPCKYDFDLTLNGSGVTKLPSIRILGVELDSMLNFIEHISIQLKEEYAKTSALRRIRHFVPMDVMLQSQSKWLGHFGVSLSPQCWCTRFGDRTAINNFERDEGSTRREKTAFG